MAVRAPASGAPPPAGCSTEPCLGPAWTHLTSAGRSPTPKPRVRPIGLKAEGNDVWIEAAVNLPSHGETNVVARYERSATGPPGSGQIVGSWCTLPIANSCEEALGSAAAPDAVFQTADGPVALALVKGAVAVFAHGDWTSITAPGYEPPALPGEGATDVFSSPTEGWLAGANALGRWSGGAGESSSTPVSWPLPDRSPLTGVALPSGAGATIGEAGALAVGFAGTTLSYDPAAGWLVQAAPGRARHANLLGVAFAGPSSAFAVGQFGVIIHWNGSAWTEDPQSISATTSQLNAVAFGADGQGWAVGANGTILHYDGHSWSAEPAPAADSGVNITSVAVAGSKPSQSQAEA